MINEDGPMDRRGGRLFSPAEAAALTELPLKAVNNAIDKEIVPAPAADSAARGSGRWLTACGLLSLSLERRLSSVLVPDERRKLFRIVEERPYLKQSSKGPLRIDLRQTRRELAGAIRRLRQIRALVDSNSAVVGGEPVFRGTRIPIHLVASLLLDGATKEQLKESYPRLTRQMIILAPLYAAAYPLRGRPRQSALPAIPLKRIVRRPLPPAKS
jgi:uncharacterized protein (DUF433 family)